MFSRSRDVKGWKVYGCTAIDISEKTSVTSAKYWLFLGSVLPYQYHIRVLEFFIVLAFAPIEAIRLSWGIRGNLTETPAFLAFSLLLSVPVLLILVYLAIFQNYVLLIEAIVVGINGVLVIIETVIGLALCATLSTGSS
ncbi:hypothetical protein GCK32_019083 [Trichostrongylus colubriformis]|uniref:Transmembrane protein 216 n=1 Tax=Trichostrongylus colubriformis TaxID=6319 RepID=A0AAN8G572_TRICO